MSIRPGNRIDAADTGEPSRDVIFQVLGNQRRRYALNYLKRHENPTEIGDMAMQLAAWENDVAREDVTPQQRKRVYNTLQQAHLPKLDETGFVKYDAANGCAELTERAGKLDIYFELVPENSLPWSEYYFILGCVSLALVTGAWLGTGPLALVPELGWAAGIALLFVVSGAVNVYYYQNVRLGHTEVPPDRQ